MPLPANRQPARRVRGDAMEDYLLHIHRLSRKGGLVRGVDLAAALGIAAPSVTGMVRRLSGQGLIDHHFYRGIALTPKGARLAALVARRREVLERFLGALGLDTRIIQRDVEGMKHCVSDATCAALQKWLETHPPSAPEADAPAGAAPRAPS